MKSGAGIGLLSFALLGLGACSRQASLPQPGSQQYQKLCSAFYLGLAALQSGEDINARKGLTDATRIVPQEPAGWLNLALLDFRQQNFEDAYKSAATAQTLVSDNSRVEALLGVIESKRGKVPEAIGHLERAVQLDGRNLKAAYALAQETERQNSEATDGEAQALLERILAAQPNNITVLLDDIRLAAKRNQVVRVRQAVASLQAESGSWPEPAKEQLKSLVATADGNNVRAAALQVQFLKNVLVRLPAYRQSLDQVRTPATSAGEPFLKFFKLPSPQSAPDPADMQIAFSQGTLPTVGKNVLWSGTLQMDGESAPVVISTDGKVATLQNGSTLALPVLDRDATEVGRHWLAAADWNYDFKVDLAFATRAGLKFYQQQAGQQFDEVSKQTRLPDTILHGSYTGVWAFDYDLDGDLDLVLGTASGPPLVLRNNGDGTFLAQHPFSGVDGLLDFASADVDGDGDPDVAMINGAGHLVAFANERLGDYRRREVPVDDGVAVALAAADVNGDGLPDLIVLNRDGRIESLSDRGAGKTFTITELAKAEPVQGANAGSLFLADLDNNGAMDLVAGRCIFLGDGKKFAKWQGDGTGWFTAAADLNGDGMLDLIGLTGGNETGGEPAVWTTHSRANYHWQTIRPLAARTSGDQRINSFGIGGEIEVRADLLTEKQIIQAPVLHFGMGSHREGTQFARIGWPNGLIQTEFNLKPDQTLLAEQRLKGSCPFLFTWNGKAMEFLKDVAPMSGALGAHDPDGKQAEVRQTRQWFSVAGNQLQPRDGAYDLRVTDEYWETYYVDQYELQAVDHPAGTRLFVDERVAVSAAPLRWYLTQEQHPFETATDDSGRDVSQAVRDLDGRVLDTFRQAVYRGVAQDHYVQLRLPERAPRDGDLYLIGEGSLRPWDDSTLVAINQGSDSKPRELSLEIRDRTGRWRVANGHLGIPAGRRKSVVLNLAGLFSREQRTRELRLRTNLEIYWDRLSWAEGVPESAAHMATPALQAATLGHRGYSEVRQTDATAPEVPVYETIVATGGRWRDLSGLYTRYGRVDPLVKEADGRFVIMNSGDELRLRFTALPAPVVGLIRDYVFVGDGWLKEGDPSFRYSQAVLPLPYPGLRTYDGKIQDLEREQAFRAHPADWQVFHTRYVDGERFGSGLWQ